MLRWSQQEYVLELMNMPLSKARQRLQEHGFVVSEGPRASGNCTPSQGRTTEVSPSAVNLLARLEAADNHINGISFYLEHSASGDVTPIPPGCVFTLTPPRGRRAALRDTE